jgi:cytoskeleton protein RodZ
MGDAQGSETRCGIGARLRAGRERAGMTVLQAAEKLHLDSRMLEALEAERFESFGAPVFVRGHLRNYADLIGEPYAELQGLFDAGIRGATPDLTRAPRAPRVFNRKRLIKPALFIVVAVVLACALWLVLTRRLN